VRIYKIWSAGLLQQGEITATATRRIQTSCLWGTLEARVQGRRSCGIPVGVLNDGVWPEAAAPTLG